MFNKYSLRFENQELCHEFYESQRAKLMKLMFLGVGLTACCLFNTWIWNSGIASMLVTGLATVILLAFSIHVCRGGHVGLGLYSTLL